MVMKMAKKVEKKEIKKTLKIGNERYKLIGEYKTKKEAEKKAEWHRYKGKKVRTKKVGDKFCNYAKLK